MKETVWLKDSLCVCSLRVPAELIRIHDAGGIRDGRTVRDETGTSGVSLPLFFFCVRRPRSLSNSEYISVHRCIYCETPGRFNTAIRTLHHDV